MELSVLLIRQIGAMFIMIALGFFALKAKIVKPDDGKTLSKITMYIINPCMTLVSFQIEFAEEKLLGLGIAVLASIFVHIIYIAVTSMLKGVLTKIERASLIYSNAGNMIIPLVNATLGPEWVFYTAAFTTVQSFLLWTNGRSLVRGKKDWDLKQIVTNPTIIAKVVSLAFFILQIKLPVPMKSAAQSMGQMIGPLSMFLVGMILANMDIKAIFSHKRAFIVVLGRLILYPLAIALIFSVFAKTGIHKDLSSILLIVLLASASPVASSITQFAQIFDSEKEYSSIINIVTTLLSIFTMPLIVMLYTSLI